MLRLILVSALCIFSLGCATIMEPFKGFVGVSTKVLEDKRKDAIKREFPLDYNKCYERVMLALKRSGAYIYARSPKKKMIAIYLSEEDTTPVGIFLKEVDAFNTQVEVSSPSKFAKETVSNRIFASLSKTDEELKKEGEDNAKKEAWDKGPDK